ncbi:lamin tail domain-containing protein [Neobacillus niacini]|uniref:lamin tail domain-containing protein n=1 Tax=Neobacillus niacini TaxID=86668 RepID=UPI0021CB8686|nr:lamin tail domain-containing protein [Neobacillus niacini]MCM3768714.1 lamin tail domain-containing protein [Neobacillus niacini]
MKRVLSIVLSLLILINPFVNATSAFAAENQQNSSIQQPVMITEIYPNDKANNQIEGAGDNDLFEFIEIYNTTNSELDFNSVYKVRYDYVSNVKDLTVTAADDPTNLSAVIPAQSPAVLWVERTSSKITGAAASLTEVDFRAYHQIPAEVPVFKLRGQDGLNNVDRGFYITSKEDNNVILSDAHYTSEDVGDGLSYHVKVPKSGTTMESFVKKGQPTPGSVQAEQLVPTANNQPAISHNPVQSIPEATDFTVTAAIADGDGDPLSVHLFYRANAAESYKEAAMTKGDSGYIYTISASEISGNAVQYYITANDGKETVKTDVFTTAIDSSGVPAEPEQPKSEYPIFFTEIYPNDKSNSHINGAGSNDLFEFVEIYNHTDEELDFNSIYKIRYDWRSGTKDLAVTAADDKTDLNVKIPANTPAVLWVERTNPAITGDAANLKEADFRAYHNVPSDVPVFKVRNQDALPNDSDRSFYITTKSNDSDIISEIRFTGEDTADGKSFHTRVPQQGVTVEAFIRKGDPTAGVVDAGQLVPSSNQKPVITHQPAGPIQKGSDYTVETAVNDADGDSLNVSLYYRFNPYGDFTKVAMEAKANGSYTYKLAADAISGAVINYYIEAADSESTVQSETFEVVVNDPANAVPPKILITEMTPNPAGDYRRGSGNQYEFMEIYNNSNELLNLKGYTLFYLYPNNSPAPKKWTIPQETAIEPYSTAIIWFAKEAVTAGFTTAEDFNIHYNSNVDEQDIIFYDNKNSADFNLPNSLERGFAISSSDSVNDIIVEAWYDASSVGSPDRMVNDIRNSAVLYNYPESGKLMERTGTRAFSNPGSIDEGQVPAPEGLDVVAPMIEHNQPFYQIQQGKDHTITIASHEPLAKAELVYGTAKNPLTDFTNKTVMSLKGQETGKYVYEARLNIAELGSYRYMIVTEDASGNITKVPYNSRGNQITVIDEAIGIEYPESGMSIADGESLSGKVGLYAYGKTAPNQLVLSLDGQKLETKPALPGKAKLGFQAQGIDYIYQASASAKNAAGEREYFTRILPSYVDGAWYTYDVAPGYFISDQIVSIHSGGENVPYDLDVHEQYFNKLNFDDFEVINVHLVLPDGTMIKPESVRSYLGNLQQTVLPYRENVFYPFGDGSAPTSTNFTKPMKSDFIFNIPAEKLTAQYAEIDTTAYADGTYLLKLDQNGAQPDFAAVTFDNTDPVIKGISYSTGKLITEGERIRGKFTFAVDAEDNLTGIAKVEAKLDGKPVEFPYETSSAKLEPGNHELHVNVYDGAGNLSFYSVSFTIDSETPDQPSELSPADFGEKVAENATLKAKVTDPNGDKIDVDFYQGSKYDFASNDGIKGFGHIADREPPLTVESTGETELSEADKKKLAYADGDYLVNDSNMGFPYHRFEVEVDEELTPGDKVELYWKGKTLPNRKVTLYAWDYSAGKWTAMKSATGDAAESDIVLTVEIDKEKFIKDGKIQAMVQDEVKNANDPFTMLWFTDTQYYAETYHYIFDGLGDWIVDEYQKGTFKYAIHSGDIVNIANDDAQWAVADRNLKKLDEAGVPYGVLAGNHDSIIDGIDYSYYYKWVGEERYKHNPWYGGSMDNNRNHYDLMSFGGHDFVIVYLGFGLEDTPETIAWANEVLQKHSDRNAILVMHAYLEYSATLSKMSQNVFDQIIVPNENVKMVMGGHYHGVATRVSEIPNQDGSTRKVLEMLSDYQGGPNGGDGYVRLLTFNPADETVSIQTYSPILDDMNFFDEPGVDSFTADYQLIDINKRVATDYFSVNVYSEKLIGSDKGVLSGETASVAWKDLQPNQTYYWYMNITDENGATRRSDIFRFATADFVSGQDPDDSGQNPDTGGKDPDNGGQKPDNGGNGPDNGGQNPDSGGQSPDNAGQNPNQNGQQPSNGNGQGGKVHAPSYIKSPHAGENALPNTATSTYNWVAVGMILILAGICINFARIMKRRKLGGN